MKRRYPYNLITHIILILYRCGWVIFFPLVILYFFKRSIKEPSYRRNLLERFGLSREFDVNSIWIHAVSLGEFRASVPLVKKLLERSEKIILTTITPAGRAEAEKLLKPDIKAGNVNVVYLPLEYNFAFNKFLKRYRPRLGLVLEIEIWPVMIAACSRHKVPLVLAQGQYVEKSFSIDRKWPWLRGALFNGFDLILAKSQFHANRYKYFSDVPIEVMGELRFDQKIPIQQIVNADKFLNKIKLKYSGRLCFCFGSTGPGEDSVLIELMKKLTEKAERLQLPRPFYIYVPRQTKDFVNIQRLLAKSGLSFVKRTVVLNKELILKNGLELDFFGIDGLLGDSLGEINFYFQIADHIFIGNSLNNLGSHNIIEPLALKKPVVVGPSVWGIEYPIIEAIEEGAIVKVKNVEELYEYWLSQLVSHENGTDSKSNLEKFYKNHSGAVDRCIQKLRLYGYL